MPIDTKSLKLNRAPYPGAGHSRIGYFAETDREAKIARVIALADSAELPRDANRETVRKFAKEHGIALRNDALAEVLKARKAVPDPGDSASLEDLSPASGTAGTADPGNDQFEHETAVPEQRGQPGTAPTGRPVPVPTTLRVGTTGQPGQKLIDDNPGSDGVETAGRKCSTCYPFACLCDGEPLP
jgi:hypothetical protein